jgi:hypothetical protein
MHRVITDYTNVNENVNVKVSPPPASLSDVPNQVEILISAPGYDRPSQVYVRLRPPGDGSNAVDPRFMERFPENARKIVLRDPGHHYGEYAFMFDQVFWTEAQQEEIFNVVCKPQVRRTSIRLLLYCILQELDRFSHPSRPNVLIDPSMLSSCASRSTTCCRGSTPAASPTAKRAPARCGALLSLTWTCDVRLPSYVPAAVQTHTMFGAGHDGRADQRGIIPRAIEYLCHRLEDRRSNGNMEVAIVVSFLEIYLDQIRDLGKVRTHSGQLLNVEILPG